MPAEGRQAPRGFIDPGINPEYYQDPDNLGFSLKSITRPIGKAVHAVTKPVGKIIKPIAKPLLAVGAVGVATGFIPGGGFLRAGASKIKNVVTGNKKKAGTVQRVASGTGSVITQALPAVTALDVNAQVPVLQRVKADPAKSVLNVGARIKREANRIAGQVSGTGAKAAAIAAAADSAAQAGDALGARRLGDAARKLRDLAASGQDTAANVASTINQAGAAAEGAAAGAVAGAGAEGAKQSISEFFSENKTPILLGGAALGAVALLRGGGGTHTWR